MGYQGKRCGGKVRHQPSGDSRQIKILNECGLVVIRKEGRKRLCPADPRKLRKVEEWAERYRRFWTEKLDALEALLDEEDDPN